METFGTLFSGLGLFIIGVRFLSLNLKRFTGRQFKSLMKRMTRTRMVAALIGFMSGMFTQSGNASVFITTSLQTAGLITLHRALTIISWANIGTAVLIFLVSINLKIFALYLLGIIGLMYYLQMDRKQKFHVSSQVLLGLALLFLGVHFMKLAANDIQAYAWVRELISHSSGSILLLAAMGAIMTFIVQSSSAVTVIAISLSAAGLFTAMQTFVIVAGTSLGSAANILFLSGSLSGTSKQLSLFQAFFKTFGSLIATLILIILYVLGPTIGLKPGILDDMPLGQQVALLYLSMVLLPTFAMTFLQKPVSRLLERLSPPTRDEQLSKPMFIYEQSLGDPDTALDLVDKEQLRLLHYLPEYLLQISEERGSSQNLSFAEISEGFGKVAKEVDGFLSELSIQAGSFGFHDRLLQNQSIQFNLNMLESSLLEFARLADFSYDKVTGQPFATKLIESLRAILDTAIDGFDSCNKTDHEITLLLTSEKGDMLNRIRQQHLSLDHGIDLEMKQLTYTLTLLFEKIIWQIRSLTLIKIRDLEDSK